MEIKPRRASGVQTPAQIRNKHRDENYKHYKLWVKIGGTLHQEIEKRKGVKGPDSWQSICRRALANAWSIDADSDTDD